ncbi:MAG: nucleoside phosphorylase [Desulfamplus sp.]|nr:nucleoside phosphorylase [Desulfamplus sp.]
MSFPTWSDLNDEPIIPPLGTRVLPDLGSVAIMVSTDPDFRYVEANCSNISPKNQFFLGSIFTSKKSNIAVAGPYLGSPCAAMVLESLIARGVSEVLVVGWCGAIAPHLKAGDIVVADAAICDEGTSRNYMKMPLNSHFPTALPSSNLSERLKLALESNSLDYQTGKIWTTDAIFRETTKKVAFFQDMGAIAVEMECAALFAVAQYHKIEIAASLIVSDSLSTPKWQPGFKEPAFKNGRKRLLNLIVDIVRSENLI